MSVKHLQVAYKEKDRPVLEINKKFDFPTVHEDMSCTIYVDVFRKEPNRVKLRANITFPERTEAGAQKCEKGYTGLIGVLTEIREHRLRECTQIFSFPPIKIEEMMKVHFIDVEIDESLDTLFFRFDSTENEIAQIDVI